MKRKKNIVLAIGDDVFGGAVAKFVEEHEWRFDVHFYLLHVYESSHGGSAVPGHPDELAQENFEYAKRVLAHIGERIHTAVPEAEISLNIARGDAKAEILRLAKRVKADLIIMGSHGRKGLRRLMLGSVSNAVVTDAACSTVIVRLPEDITESLPLDFTAEDLPENMVTLEWRPKETPASV